MSISSDDLRDFQLFANERLNSGDVSSLVELANQWEARREHARQRDRDETLADIHASHADVDAGRVIPLAEAFSDIRQQLRLG